jgi:hypothetical protein
MADVYHHYLGRDGKLPKPSAAQLDRETSRAELVAAQARERIAKAILAEAEVMPQAPRADQQKYGCQAIELYNGQYQAAPALARWIASAQALGQEPARDEDDH